ncbi:MAG: class I SAM-dependent methyltransferase [Sedimenticola sp.]
MYRESESDIKSYYKERAPIYDLVYSYPERQKDLRFLETYIPEKFCDLDVIEIAAGTGYWSQFIISKANSVLATDITQEALSLIKDRQTNRPIDIKMIDAFELNGIERVFSGAFAGLWISHIPRHRINHFLKSLHSCLLPGSPVLFLDNTIAQCKRLPISYTDHDGNTYQDRKLANGEIYRVLKNFPSETDLKSLTANYGIKQKFTELDNFWLFEYVVK